MKNNERCRNEYYSGNGSPVPSFIYFEFYDSPVTIKVEAYFSDFQIGKIYFYFPLVIDKSG